jgi:hypothetical protein
MAIGVFPKFSNIFPNQPVPKPEDLLRDVPSQMVIGILSYINGRLYINESIEEQETLFGLLIERLPKTDFNSIRARYNDFVSGFSRQDLFIFPLLTLLQIIEWEVVNYRKIPFTTSTAEQELKILQVILIYNQRLDESHLPNSTETNNSNQLLKLLWENSLPQLEFTRRKLFFSQILLGFKFIDYLDANHQAHLESYLTYLGINHKEDIFKGVFELLINGYNKSDRSFRHSFPVSVLKRNKLLESFVLDLETLNTQEYIDCGNAKFFKGLRKYPLLKHDEETFDIVNWNFVSDKMTTNALIFDFYQNSTIKPKMRFEEYKSEIGLLFSEKSFLVGFLRNTFRNSKYTHLTSEINEAITSDYYLRIDNKIIIIEYKDCTMADAIKNSSYDLIKEYFETIFIQSKRSKPKGVTQLIAQIDRIDKEYDRIEDFVKIGIEKSRLIIFPVIITKDFSFTVNGLNHFLNEHFRKELSRRKYPFFLIEDIILVDLKRLMDWSDDLECGRITLPSLLNNYLLKLSFYTEAIQKEGGQKYVLDSIASFNHLMIPQETKNITETNAFQEILKYLKFKQ